MTRLASFSHFFATSLMVACVALSSSPLLAQRDLKEIPPADAALEKATFVVADGFEVNLFAADPAIAKPIQINFDRQGRLWIASSSVYPHIEPGKPSNDRILVLEDLDGDGVSDKTHVFADGLLIPTGVAPGDGGAYVANSTELLHLYDTDGDLRADGKRVVLSGFGTEDTHHILHTFRWGPDGWLYFNQSIYIHSHIETPYGPQRLNGGGVWRFRPETLEMQILMRGLVNSWGHDFDRYGQSFATDGAGGEGINYVLPGAYYTTAVRSRPCSARTQSGKSEALRARINQWSTPARRLAGQRKSHMTFVDIVSVVLSCQKTVPASLPGSRSNCSNPTMSRFAPSTSKMGPDGAIYVADWYNPIIQHGEVDFRDPRRDHVHGRIWRISRKDRQPLKRPAIGNARPHQLCAMLASPERWTRQQARLKLRNLGSSIDSVLRDWTDGLDSNRNDYDQLRLEAMWTHEAIRSPNPALLRDLTSVADGRVRAAAVRMLVDWQHLFPDALPMLERLVEDNHPRVRLEAVRALAALRSENRTGAGSQPIEVATRVMNHPMDRFLDYALWLTARETQQEWLAELRAGNVDFGGDSRHLAFALKAVGSSEAVESMVTLVADGQLAEKDAEGLIDAIAASGNAEELRQLFEFALATPNAFLQARTLNALANKPPGRNRRPAGSLLAIVDLLNHESPPVSAAAARAAGKWQVKEARNQLIQRARSLTAPDNVRRGSIEALGNLGGKDAADVLEELARSAGRAPIRLAAIRSLLRLNRPAAARLAVQFLRTTPTDRQTTELTSQLLSSFPRGEAGADGSRESTWNGATAKGHCPSRLTSDIGVRTVTSRAGRPAHQIRRHEVRADRTLAERNDIATRHRQNPRRREAR